MRRKTVVVLESGRIPELNVCGPIQTPTRINIKNIALMVKNGKNVQECDPKDPHNQDKRIQLTTENVGKENFGAPEVKTESKPQQEKTPKSKIVVETAKEEKVEEKKDPEDKKVSTIEEPNDVGTSVKKTPADDSKSEDKKNSNKEKNKDKK